MANKAQSADHRLTIDLPVNNPAASVYARNGYWLTKRRDGRSNNWMIARWERRTVIYKSAGTTDLDAAKARLDEVAEKMPKSRRPW